MYNSRFDFLSTHKGKFIMRKIFLLLVSVGFLSSCALVGKFLSGTLKSPEVSYRSFGLGSVNAEMVELKPGITIKNPNDVDIPIEMIDYKLDINKKTMLEGKTNKVGNLQALKSKDVDLSLEITKDSLSALQDLLLKSEKVDYHALLNVKVMSFNVPIEFKGTLYKPSIKFAGVKIDDKNSSFQKISGNIQLVVENKNTFGLPLKDISYSIKSGKNKILAGALEGEVGAQSSSVLNLPFAINPTQIAGSLLGLLNGKLPVGIEVTSPFGTYDYETEFKL